MANENLGASFSIDITDLKAGLAQANRLIRDCESEFREAAAGMDDWSSSMRGLEMRSESLSKQYELQSAKVDALVRAKHDIIKKMTEEGKSQEEISLAVDDTNKSIEKESKQLDRLGAELGKTGDKINKFAEEAEEGGKSAEKAGEEAKESKEGFTVMKGAIANLIATGITALISACGEAISSIAGLAESTREYRRDMSAFAQNAETAGVSLDTMKDKLIEVGAVTGETDAALEGMNMLMATGMDASNIEYAADAFAGAASKFSGLKFEGLAEGLQETLATGAAVGPFAELIERTGVDLEEFNKGMEKCKTEAERQAYAMQFLTESGLAEANEAFREMNKSIIEAEEAEARYTEAMAELGAITEPIMTTMKNLVTDLVKEITPFVSLIADGLTGAFKGTEGASTSFFKGVNGLLDTVVTKVSEALPFVVETIASIVPFLLSSLLSAITDILPVVADAAVTILPDLITNIAEAIVEMLPVITDAIVELVPLIISALLSTLPYLLTAVINMVLAVVDGLSAMLPQIVSAVMAVLPQLINSLIASIPQLLKAAVTLLMALVQAVPVIIVALVEALPSIIDTTISVLLDSIPILLDAAISLLMALVDAIPTIIDALVAALPQIIDSIITGLLEALPQLMNASITLFFAIIDSIPTIVRSLYGAMPQIINTIMTSILNALPKMFSTANQLFSQIGSAIKKFAGEAPGKMGEVITAMLSSLGESLGAFFDIGFDIVRGIWDGIVSNVNWLKNRLTGWVGDVVQFIKDLFIIESPSKLMRDEVGKYIAQGIGVGFEENIGDVNRMIENSFDFSPKLSRGVSDSGSMGLASGSTAGVTVYQTNNYAQAHSRYEIWQSKEQTASAVKLALIGV